MRNGPARRKDLARALLASALALMLAACGGGSGSGGTSPGGGGGGAPTAFYLSGVAGSGNTGGGGMTLVGENPNIPAAATIGGGLATTWASNEATIGQWTASGGMAGNSGVRYRVWTGADNKLYSTDLAIVSGVATPSTQQLSTLDMTTACASPEPTVINDYAAPANSLLAFRLLNNGACGGGSTDLFAVIALSATPSTTTTPTLFEPVDAVRDATGAIKQVLLVDHATNQVAVAAAATPGTVTDFGAVLGTGITLPTGDFRTLAVVPQADGSSVWVYRAFNMIQAASISSAGVASAPVSVFPASDADVIQGPAFVDGTNVYIAMTDVTNNVSPPPAPPLYTCQLVTIDTTKLTANSGVIALHENTSGTGFTLVGVAGASLVYINNNVVLSATPSGTMSLESIPKTSRGLTAPAAVIQTVTYPKIFDPNLSGITVGNNVYVNVTDQSLNTMQAYFAVAATAGSSTAIGNTAFGSRVLGGEPAKSVSTAVPGAAGYVAATVAAFAKASDFSAASVGSYAGGATASTSYGTMMTLQTDSASSGMLSESPLQTGMPAMISISGQNARGNGATDLYFYIPGTAGSLKQVTTNLQ